MQTLLYFEEYESPLSRTLFDRTDVNFVILRTTNNLRFFSEEYLKETAKYKIFVSDFNKPIEDEVERFKIWCLGNDIIITNFLNDSEFYLEYSNKFASLLGIESLTEEQSRWVRDKVDMKKKFNEIGLSTVKFEAVESKEDVIEFFNKNGKKRIVFKPRREMNSIGVYMINSIEDIEKLNVEFIADTYMVETFCFDHEWSVESIVQDGIVLDSYLTYIPNATIWASIANNLNCHMTVPKIPNFFKFKPKELIQQIVDGMNLKNGVMTIEVFIDKEGNVMPSELGWRLPGCQATTNHSYSYDINIYEILIDIMLHKKIELNYRDKIISVGDLYLPNKEGIITHITPLSELMKYEGVIGGEIFTEVGKYQKKRRVGNDASGWVQVMGENELETLKRMETIFNNYIIETEEVKKEGILKYVKKM